MAISIDSTFNVPSLSVSGSENARGKASPVPATSSTIDPKSGDSANPSVLQGGSIVQSDRSFDAISRLREALRGTEVALEKLGQLRQPLAVIVKQYPPFAFDSEERVAYLNQFSTLRKEIEALTRLLGNARDTQAAVPDLGRGSDDAAVSAGLDSVDGVIAQLTGRRDALVDQISRGIQSLA